MRILRLTGAMFAVVFALSLVSSSAASAIPLPLFVPANGQLVIGTSGLSVLISPAGGQSIHCESDVFHGFVLSSLLIGNATVHYLGCTSSGPKKANCTVKNIGGTEGLLITSNVHGILGLILPSGEIGILFLPTSGKIFLTLAENACTEEAKVTGTVAGLITPVGTRSKTGKVIFGVTSGKQNISSIDLTHGLGQVEPELVAFSTTSTLEQTENVEFAESTEVT